MDVPDSYTMLSGNRTSRTTGPAYGAGPAVTAPSTIAGVVTAVESRRYMDCIESLLVLVVVVAYLVVIVIDNV